MNDLKVQIKTLEEKNTSLIKSAIELEEVNVLFVHFSCKTKISYSMCKHYDCKLNLLLQEQRKTNALRTQIESYKAHISELDSKLLEEGRRADKSEFELQQNLEKLAMLYKQQERLSYEVESLKEKNEEVQFSQLKGRLFIHTIGYGSFCIYLMD